MFTCSPPGPPRWTPLLSGGNFKIIIPQIILTELLRYVSITGPALPQNCIDGSMVSSSNGQEAILVGCAENPERLYQLRWSNETSLEWVLMKQMLKYPRSNAVAMLIPNALTQCNNFQPGNLFTICQSIVSHCIYVSSISF